MTYSQLYNKNSASVRRGQSLGTYKSSKSGLGPVSGALLLGAIIVVLGLMYLTQITKTSVFGFEVNELKEKKAQLTDSNQDLKIEASRLQSINRIRESEVAKGLTEVDEITYVGDNSEVQ